MARKCLCTFGRALVLSQSREKHEMLVKMFRIVSTAREMTNPGPVGKMNLEKIIPPEIKVVMNDSLGQDHQGWIIRTWSSVRIMHCSALKSIRFVFFYELHLRATIYCWSSKGFSLWIILHSKWRGQDKSRISFFFCNPSWNNESTWRLSMDVNLRKTNILLPWWICTMLSVEYYCPNVKPDLTDCLS